MSDDDLPVSAITQEVRRRRTFAIISHPEQRL
jgi:peptide subunit release factor RF-3